MAAHNRYVEGMEQLVAAVSDLSLASDVQGVCDIVRKAARRLTGADGATFILREGDQCHYVDEDAIGPLWKGQHFPMKSCISGWVMTHKRPVVIEDIYSDPRIPDEAYRPTFVKSLALVPIRTADPIGAIGNYWATPHKTESYELRLLQALADSTSVALENIKIHQDLEARVHERTEALEAMNTELKAFSYSVSHDLRAPVRAINAFATMLLKDHVSFMPEEAGHRLGCILKATNRMEALIKDLLELSHASRQAVERNPVDLSAMVGDILRDLRDRHPERLVDVQIAPNVHAHCDARLVHIALENLLGNAWKFTSVRDNAAIEFGVDGISSDAYFVRDNGAGFTLPTSTRLFAPFQRFHTQAEFPGTGLGLATVKRVIDKHGGKLWVETEIDHGTTFYFTLN